MQLDDQMREMKESHQSVQLHDSYAIVRPDEVLAQLKGKLTDEDIRSGSISVMDTVQITNICRELCNGCQNIECNSRCGFRTLPYGNHEANVMFINKQPTIYETATGVPFSDKEGVFLTLILQKMNVRRSDVYMTDFIKCTSNNVDESSYKNCLKYYIDQELQIVDPKVIITNGISLLRTLNQNTIISGLPDNVAYGNMYDVVFGIGRQAKVMAMYDLDKVLAKTGDDYERCKNELWHQLVNAFQLVAKYDWKV